MDKSVLRDLIGDIKPRCTFDLIPSLFPQMDFKPRPSGGLQSKKKLDLSEGKDHRPDKTVITSKYPFNALEQGGESVDLIWLYMDINKVTFNEALKVFCNATGVEYPTTPLDSERYKEQQRRESTLHSISEKMRYALFNSAEGKPTLEYLRSRGYDDMFIEYAQFGYVTTEALNELRQLTTYTNPENGKIENKIPDCVGQTHLLAIPYHTEGRLLGFTFRTITDEKDSRENVAKYCCFKGGLIDGTTKSNHLFGLKQFYFNSNTEEDGNNIVIVEGEIDALRATFAGIPNVVAVSGKGNRPELALKRAYQRGARFATILLDNDGSVELNDIVKLGETCYNIGLTPFVATLPENGGKDVDEFLNLHSSVEEGLRGLQEVIKWKQGLAMFQFLSYVADQRIKRDDTITPTVARLVENEAIRLMSKPYCGASERSDIANSFEPSISSDTVLKRAEQVRAEQEERRYREQLANETRKLLSLASDAAQRGDTDGALKLMQSANGINTQNNVAEFNDLFRPTTLKDIEAQYKNTPEGLKTPYYFKSTTANEWEQLILPSGAMTYICAPTSHGKSQFLSNLAIEAAKDNTTNGNVLYFSFEEDRKAVTLNMLRIFANVQLSKNTGRTLKSIYKDRVKGYGYIEAPREGKIAQFEAKEREFYDLIENGKLTIVAPDSTFNDVKKLVNAIRHYGRNNTVKAVFIDYVQLLTNNDTRAARKDQLKDISNTLMNASKEMQVPFVMAAQMNREALSPIEMEVQNIAEASDIEHSANTIILLWRDTVDPLNSNGKKSSWRETGDQEKALLSRGLFGANRNRIYAKIAKNREGSRNIDAVFEVNHNTGAIAPDPLTVIPKEGEQLTPKDPYAF